MYKAHFEINKKEPEKMYFSVSEGNQNKMEFVGIKKESVRFTVTKDKHLEVY